MRDLRYAIRVLLKAPAFTATAVLTLALCIGANTAIYSVVDRVLLRPLPYPRPDRLAMVVRHYQGAGVVEDDTSQAGVTWVALQEGAAATLDFAATVGGAQGVNFVAGQRAEYVKQQRVSAGYFRVLGVHPELGRELSDEEDRVNGPAAVVLSRAFWQHAFKADPSVVGQRLTLRGEPYTIVGVMPASFRSAEPVDLWTPLRPSPRGEGGGENYTIIARLRDGVSWPEADGAVASATDATARNRYGKGKNAKVDVRLRVIPLQTGQANDVREPLVILWSAVGMVLLIGCVNIAGLLMARGVARAPEIATRSALGGGRGAILRQLLTESVVLGVLGGVAGAALGYIGSRAFASLMRDAFGVMQNDVGLDARVLATTAAIALGTSLVFGLVPALQAGRVNLRATLVDAGSASIAGAARSWPRRALVVIEVALGVVLLVGAGLLIRSFDRLMMLRAGFDGTHVMTATLSLQDARYQSTGAVNRLFDASLSRMRELAGVEKAAVALTLPYERALNVGGRWVSAKPGGDSIGIMNLTYVTLGYFETLRIPLARGRVFTDADSANAAPVMVVNEAFVARYSRDEDVIGRQVTAYGARTIIGVVGDIQQKGSFGNLGPVAPTPAAYIPASQTSDAMLKTVHTWFSPSWFVRLRAPQPGIVSDMRRAVESIDPLLPFAKFRTFDEVRSEAVATQRAQALLLGTLAGLALLLAAVGLYGLVANSVAERTRELGIRIALGATSRQAIAAAALPGVALAAAGVAIGGVAARLGVTTMRHLVWGVSVADPLTYVAAIAMVLGVATIAALVPAFRIVRLNPIRALRQT